jgi:hypothetical protein
MQQATTIIVAANMTTVIDRYSAVLADLSSMETLYHRAGSVPSFLLIGSKAQRRGIGTLLTRGGD